MTFPWPRATYSPNPIAEYAGNPFIEALPPIRSDEDFVKAVTVLPHFEPEERNLPAELRRHLVKRLDKFCVSTSEMVRAHQRLDVELRHAYVAKDPRRLTARQSMYDVSELFSLEREAVPNCQLITGLSGSGKSTLLKAILSIYPQVVIHEGITPGIARETQVIWLKVDCPQDAGLRGLCLAILEAIDKLLGTSYLREWGGERTSIEAFLQNIYQITNNLHIGVFVLDELQHLRSAKAGGQEKMLNFFVNLINGVGIPLVFAGTYALEAIVTDQLRNARRATGVGTTRVCRLEEQDALWHLFVKTLWHYQWVTRPVALSEEIEDVLYSCTQGIRDCVVRLFSAAQNLAIDNRTESVTVETLREVYDRFFTPMHAAIALLRAGAPDDDPIFDSLLTKELGPQWPQGAGAPRSDAAVQGRSPTKATTRKRRTSDYAQCERVSGLPPLPVGTSPLQTADLRTVSGNVYAQLRSLNLVDDGLISILSV